MEIYTYYVKGTMIGRKEVEDFTEMLSSEVLALDCDDIHLKIKEDSYCELAEYVDDEFLGVVTSILPDVIKTNGKLFSLTTITTTRKLSSKEKHKILDFIEGQFSDGWGEGFEQFAYAEGDEDVEYEEEYYEEDEEGNDEYVGSSTETRIAASYYYASFWYSEGTKEEYNGKYILKYVVDPDEDITQPAGEDGTSHVNVVVEPVVPAKPKCKLIGQDGNIFNLLSIACRCLDKVGSKLVAKEMTAKVYASDSYSSALAIIGEYVEIC